MGFCKDGVYSRRRRQKARGVIKSTVTGNAATALLKWTFKIICLHLHCVCDVHSGHIQHVLDYLTVTGGHAENIRQINSV